MGWEMYEPWKSDRAKLLFTALLPYIRKGMAIMDIGCANGSMAYYFKKEFKEKIDYFGWDKWGEPLDQAKLSYPKYRWQYWNWTKGNLNVFDKRYDIIIHVGMDNWNFSNLWEIHEDLINKPELLPDYILFEAGAGNAKYPYCMESMRKAENIYSKAKWSRIAEGIIKFDLCHLYERHWSIWRNPSGSKVIS